VDDVERRDDVVALGQPLGGVAQLEADAVVDPGRDGGGPGALELPVERVVPGEARRRERGGELDQGAPRAAADVGDVAARGEALGQPVDGRATRTPPCTPSCSAGTSPSGASAPATSGTRSLRRPMRRLLVIALLAALAALAPGVVRDELDGLDGRTADARVGRVVRVVDGDTLHVRLASGRERVRLIGIDTPEATSEVECGGRAATAAARRLVGGRRVRLRTDVEERDRYGRLLAYVERAADGLDVNAELLRRGHAEPLTVAPNVRHAARFARLARRARAARRGLWRACAGH